MARASFDITLNEVWYVGFDAIERIMLRILRRKTLLHEAVGVR